MLNQAGCPCLFRGDVGVHETDQLPAAVGRAMVGLGAHEGVDGHVVTHDRREFELAQHDGDLVGGVVGLARSGQKVPTTHQITNRADVIMGLTGGNVVLSVAFALLPNVIYLLFAKYFNEECSTHIDPPAVAIEIVTLALGLLF